MKSKILLLFAFLSGASFAGAFSYVEAKARADSDEASLTADQSGALVASQGQAGGESFAKCPLPTPDADLSPFSLVMELDSSGKIVKTWLRGSSPIATCFRSEMIKKSLFQPPRAPFYTSFDMSWKP
jgi:hypothetical protein